jgi:hypothetical protein
MPEPSLSEIVNVPREASVNPGVELSSGAETVRVLNQASQFNAEMQHRRYAENLENLKGIYSDIGNVQGMALMEADRPEINKQLASILEEIGSDPRSALAGPKYAKIQADLGKVRSMATQSKQDNLAYQNANNFLQTDADLQTPENNAIVQNYQSSKLGQRKFPMLQMPPSFDAQKAHENILKGRNVAVNYAESEFSPDNKFLTRSTGTDYKRDPYLKDWNAGYATSPKVQKWAEYTFNKAKGNPAEIGAYADPDTGDIPQNPQQLYQNLGKSMWGQTGDIRAPKTSVNIANPYELNTQKAKIALTLEGVKEGNREKLAAAKKTLENQPVPQNAAFLVKTYATIIAPSGGASQSLNLPGGQKVTEQPINNVSNNILKQFVESERTSIKTGSALSQVSELISSGKDPDLTTRTKDGGIRLTFYKRYKQGDTIPAGKSVGDPIVDADGTYSGESTQVIPARLVMTTLAPSLISKPIIGQTVETASNYLQGKTNEQIDETISPEKVEQGTLGDQKGVSSAAKASESYSVKGKKYTHKQLTDLGYSDEQIESAIKAGTIKK